MSDSLEARLVDLRADLQAASDGLRHRGDPRQVEQALMVTRAGLMQLDHPAWGTVVAGAEPEVQQLLRETDAALTGHGSGPIPSPPGGTPDVGCVSPERCWSPAAS